MCIYINQRWQAKGIDPGESFELSPPGIPRIMTDFAPAFEQEEPPSPPESIGDDISIRSGTPAPSVYSFSSSRDGAHFLRDVDGRSFNSQNELYFLPADEPEFTRLDKQHLMLRLALPGLYPCPEAVNEALAPVPGAQRAVLDLGTGGGNWAIAMAEEFPHAEVVGVDLAPSTTRAPPPNCRFEFDDVNLGLPHYHGMFDVVHARACANGLKDYNAFIDEAALCLKPGGVILLCEGDLQLYDENFQPQAISMDNEGWNGKNKSWMGRMLFEVFNTMQTRGSSIDGSMYVELGLKSHPLFKNTGSKKLFTPIGPWLPSPDPQTKAVYDHIGTLMRQNALEFIRALRPLLVSEGYFPETVDTWIDRIDDELNNLRAHMFTRWRYAWGIKRHPDECFLVSSSPENSVYSLPAPLSMPPTLLVHPGNRFYSMSGVNGTTQPQSASVWPNTYSSTNSVGSSSAPVVYTQPAWDDGQHDEPMDEYDENASIYGSEEEYEEASNALRLQNLSNLNGQTHRPWRFPTSLESESSNSIHLHNAYSPYIDSNQSYSHDSLEHMEDG